MIAGLMFLLPLMGVSIWHIGLMPIAILLGAALICVLWVFAIVFLFSDPSDLSDY